MIGQYFKNIFNKEEQKPEQNTKFYSPLRIGMHSTINIQTVDWLMFLGKVHPEYSFPSTSLSVDAISETDMVMGDIIVKVYLTDLHGSESYVLSLYVCNNESGKTITESTLLKVINTIVPETEASWERYMADIGFKTIELDGLEYERVWGDEYTEKSNLVEFKEVVNTATTSINYTNNYLLYSRDISDNVKEQLIVGTEESPDSAELVMMVGLNVNLANIEVI